MGDWNDSWLENGMSRQEKRLWGGEEGWLGSNRREEGRKRGSFCTLSPTNRTTAHDQLSSSNVLKHQPGFVSSAKFSSGGQATIAFHMSLPLTSCSALLQL
jgi:hypothetical protein